MVLQQLGRVVASWAEAKPSIQCVWFFGSRVTGKHRPDSDIDIAVSLSSRGGEALAEFWDEDDDWVEELQRLLPWPVDLELFSDGTPNMRSYVREAGELVFQRAGCDCLALSKSFREGLD